MKQELFKLYTDIKLGQNEICHSCISNEDSLTRPLSYYYADKEFNNFDDTVLFVGKTAIGGDDFPLTNLLFSDATNFGELSLDLKEEYATRRAFYSYTNEIIKRYYGSYEVGKKFIALTNIVKCNNTSTKDETSLNMKTHCIDKLQVIWKEIEILNPKRVIFYTARHYDDFIRKFKPTGCIKIVDIIDNYCDCWWHRKFLDNKGNIIFDFLRIYHPERKPKEDYVAKVVKWLKETKRL